MTMHGSFASKGGFAKKRNVLTRIERIEHLKGKGKWGADAKKTSSIFNLPKVRTDI
ncbi:MAG: small basic protein [Planctomycetota bacterium]